MTPDGQSWPTPEHHELYLTVARLLGRRTAELHRAFAIDTDDPAFAREPVGRADLEAWLADARAQVENGFAHPRGPARGAPARVRRADIESALAARPAVEAALASFEAAAGRARQDPPARRLPSGPGGGRQGRHHGPRLRGRAASARSRSAAPRARPSATLRACCARSTTPPGPASSASRESDPAATGAAAASRPGLARSCRSTRSWTAIGRRSATARAGPPIRPKPTRLLRLFMVQKLFYEVGYEAANRPGWLRIPLARHPRPLPQRAATGR